MSDEGTEQAMEVPLTEQLRSIPADYRTCRAIQWASDGTETGHQYIPVGYMMHRAAAELDALRERCEGLQGQLSHKDRIIVEADNAISLTLKRAESAEAQLAYTDEQAKLNMETASIHLERAVKAEAQLATAREDAIEKVSLMSVPEICALNANVVIFSDRQDEKIEILMSALAVAQDYIKRGAIILTQPQILEVVERALSPLSDKTGFV